MRMGPSSVSGRLYETDVCLSEKFFADLKKCLQGME